MMAVWLQSLAGMLDNIGAQTWSQIALSKLP